MRAAPGVVAITLLCACHDASPPSGAPASTAEVDALWKLAPDDAIVGVVVSPRALAMAEHGWQDVHAYVKAVPELAAIDRALRDELEEQLGTSAVTLADLGLTATRGAALFVTRGGQSVAIVPLADRDKFLAVAHGTRGPTVDTLPHGTCAPIRELYACSSTPELFAHLGSGATAGSAAIALQAKLAAVGTRGDIEAVALALPLQASAPIDLAGVVQIERGAVTLRFAALGVSATTTASLGAPASVRTDGERTSGFVVANVAKMLAQVPPAPVMPNLTMADLAHSIADPVTLAIPAGAIDLDLRVPLTDPAPFTQFVAHCHDLPALGALGATNDAEGCHVVVPAMDLTVDMWVDGKTLRVGKRHGAASTASAPVTPLGKELAAGSWQLAVWGRGTMFAPLGTTMPPAMLPDQIKLMIRGVSLVNEVGAAVRVDDAGIHGEIGLRTLWANPDDVVTGLTAISPDDIVSGAARDRVKALAAGAPTSPFAGDYAAGSTGLAAPALLSGVFAAVAIPAFTRYMALSRAAAAPAQVPPATP